MRNLIRSIVALVAAGAIALSASAQNQKYPTLRGFNSVSVTAVIAQTSAQGECAITESEVVNTGVFILQQSKLRIRSTGAPAVVYYISTFPIPGVIGCAYNIVLGVRDWVVINRTGALVQADIFQTGYTGADKPEDTAADIKRHIEDLTKELVAAWTLSQG